MFRLSDEFDRKREQLCRRDVAHIKDHELLEDNTSYGETFFVPPREYMSVALRLHSSSEFSPQPQQLLDEQAEGIDEAGSVVAGCTMALFWDIRAPSRSPDSEIRAAVPELILGPLLRHVGPTDATVWLESLAGIGVPDMDWRLTHSEPWFENHVATLELDGPHAKITFEEAIQNNSGEPDLQSIRGRGPGSLLHARGGLRRLRARSVGDEAPSDGEPHTGGGRPGGVGVALLAPPAPAGRILGPLIPSWPTSRS